MYNLNHTFSDKMTNCVNIVFSVFNYMNIADKSHQPFVLLLTTEILEYVSDGMNQDYPGKAHSVKLFPSSQTATRTYVN